MTNFRICYSSGKSSLEEACSQGEENTESSDEYGAGAKGIKLHCKATEIKHNY